MACTNLFLVVYLGFEFDVNCAATAFSLARPGCRASDLWRPSSRARQAGPVCTAVSDRQVDCSHSTRVKNSCRAAAAALPAISLYANYASLFPMGQLLVLQKRLAVVAPPSWDGVSSSVRFLGQLLAVPPLNMSPSPSLHCTARRWVLGFGATRVARLPHCCRLAAA